ncbi:mitogen-activated protein kinase 2 [Stylonychia lemnae]|uniref:Mitogen-activated protein kinase 2 n=1 Tax=Stylonychia lemnae TaxID=5949 RepID=A0A078B8Y5_STYLE|nr:mitogen-activated protein kinase 2 [Stylonychia lemnae]|eukprot:CDW90696.1 mitogen-activated protein kinase 2 [Stylonychia lemnae]
MNMFEDESLSFLNSLELYPSILKQYTRYQVQKKLGEGSYGEVWLAYDAQNQIDVAIKIYKNPKDSVKIASSILSEISIMRQLSQSKNPNMIRLYDILTGLDDKGKHQIAAVMEYIPNTLDELMRDPSNFVKNPGLIESIMRELLTGLSFLHQCGIIHRDLKPTNILFKQDCEGRIVLKIIDFSISKVKTDEGLEFLNNLFYNQVYKSPFQGDYTKEVTTRPYRAPEVAMMARHDFQVDIWAAGCILAEMLISTIAMKRQLLFPARQCQPLSPNMLNPQLSKEQSLQQVEDLLVLQIKFREPLSMNEFNFLDSNRQKDYVRIISQIRTNYKINYTLSYFQQFGSQAFDLLNGMLAFNPSNRFDALKSLKHPYLTESDDDIESILHLALADGINQVIISDYHQILKSIQSIEGINKMIVKQQSLLNKVI